MHTSHASAVSGSGCSSSSLLRVWKKYRKMTQVLGPQPPPQKTQMKSLLIHSGEQRIMAKWLGLCHSHGRCSWRHGVPCCWVQPCLALSRIQESLVVTVASNGDRMDFLLYPRGLNHPALPFHHFHCGRLLNRASL